MLSAGDGRQAGDGHALEIVPYYIALYGNITAAQRVQDAAGAAPGVLCLSLIVWKQSRGRRPSVRALYR